MKADQQNFGKLLKELRNGYRGRDQIGSGLTLRELGDRAGINFARIGDLEAGRRFAGEETLKKLAAALELDEVASRDFMLRGMRAGSEMKLPEEYRGIPAELFELLMREILGVTRGKSLENVCEVGSDPLCDLLWKNNTGEWFAFEIIGASGSDPKEAIRKLRRKLKRKAEQER